MKSYSIQWTQTDLAELAKEKYTHFYVFEKAGRILFVGNAHGRIFSSHIASVADVLSITGANLWLGRIVRGVSSRFGKNEQEHIKNMIAFSEKPRFNGQETHTMDLSKNFAVKNHGCPSLSKFIRSEYGRMFRSGRTSEKGGSRVHA